MRPPASPSLRCARVRTLKSLFIESKLQHNRLAFMRMAEIQASKRALSRRWQGEGSSARNCCSSPRECSFLLLLRLDHGPKLNRALSGWANHFNIESVSKAYRSLDSDAAVRLRPVVALQAKSQAKQRRKLSTLASLRTLQARPAGKRNYGRATKVPPDQSAPHPDSTALPDFVRRYAPIAQ